MSTSIKTWLDNAILQSVAESYLDLIPEFGGVLSLDTVLSNGVNHPVLNPNGQGATALTQTQIINGVRDNYQSIS